MRGTTAMRIPALVLAILFTTVLATPGASAATARVAFGSDGTVSAPVGWRCEDNSSGGTAPPGYTYHAVDCFALASQTTCSDPQVAGYLEGSNGQLEAEAHCTGSAPIAAICNASVLRFTLSPPSISPSDSCSASAAGTVPMVMVKCVAITGAAISPPLITGWKVECIVTV